jgi:hypothetical protein
MDRYVEEIARIMPPPAEGGGDIDWGRLERDFRISFPQDFKDFARVFGAGVIDEYVSISIPDPGNSFVDLIQKSRNFVETLHGVKETLPIQLSYPLESRVGGIIMWAANEDGDLCFWIPDVENPNQWRIGVYSRNYNDWHEYPFGFSEFLFGILTGVIESPFSRSDFPPKSPHFKSWHTALNELLNED